MAENENISYCICSNSSTDTEPLTKVSNIEIIGYWSNIILGVEETIDLIITAPVFVHGSCRRRFTDPKRRAKQSNYFTPLSVACKKSRTSYSDFDWKNKLSY